MKNLNNKMLFAEALQEGINDFARQAGYKKQLKQKEDSVKKRSVISMIVAVALGILMMKLNSGI